MSDHVTCTVCLEKIGPHHELFQHGQCGAPKPEKPEAERINFWALQKRVNRAVKRLRREEWRSKTPYRKRRVVQIKVKQH